MNRKKITLNEELSRMKQLFGHMGIPARLIKEAVTGGETGLMALKGLETGSSVAIALPRASEAIRLGFIENLSQKGINSLEEMKTKFGGTMEQAATAFLKTLPEAEQTALLSKFSTVASEENIAALTGLNKLPNIETKLKELGNSTLSILEKRKTQGINTLTSSEIKVIESNLKFMEENAAGNTTITNVVNGVKAEVDLIQNPIGTTTDLTTELLKFPDVKKDYDLATTSQKNYANEIVKQVTSDEQALKILNKMNDYFTDPVQIQKMQGSYGWDKFESGWNRLWRMVGKPGENLKFKNVLNIILVVLLIWSVFKWVIPIFTDDEEIKLPDLSFDTKDKNCIDSVQGSNTLTDDQLAYAAITFGCRRTKEDDTDNKIVLFEKIDGEKFKVRTKGGCIETHSGGINGKLESSPCTESDNNNDDENNDDENNDDNNNDDNNNDDNNNDDDTSECALTNSAVEGYCSDNGLNCTNIKINTSDCTVTWTEDGDKYGPYSAEDLNL